MESIFQNPKILILMKIPVDAHALMILQKDLIVSALMNVGRQSLKPAVPIFLVGVQNMNVANTHHSPLLQETVQYLALNGGANACI